MLWEFDEELRALVHDTDSTLQGAIHRYFMHINAFEKTDIGIYYASHKNFLRIFKEEFANPESAAKNAPPAVLFHALIVWNILDVAGERTNSVKALDYYHCLFNALKTHNQSFLKNVATVEDAVKKYNEKENNDWVLFEYLSYNITNTPGKTVEDQKFADYILAIYKKLTPSDEKVQKNRKLSEQNANGQHEASSSVAVKSKKNKATEPYNNSNHDHNNNLQTSDDSLFKEILALNPSKDTLTDMHFKSLCQAMVKQMPYQNKKMESYDLLMHQSNEPTYKKLILAAIRCAKASDLPNKALILLIIGKFNDECLRLKNAPIVFDMKAVKKVFEYESQGIWAARAKSSKVKDHLFEEMFPAEYMNKLTNKQRAQVRSDFEKTTIGFIGIPNKASVIFYCANKICPSDIYNEITLDSTSTTVAYNAQHNTANNSKVVSQQTLIPYASKVKPGERSETWEKFISKVYAPFNDKNPYKLAWDSNLNDEQKKEKLKPILAQFNKDYPEQIEKAQVQGKFLSFIGDVDDCKFAEGAQDYAFLFIELMVPGNENAIQQTLSETKSVRKQLLDMKNKFTIELKLMK